MVSAPLHGHTHYTMQGQTAEQICGQNKNARDAFRKMWKRKVGTPFSINHVITPDEAAKMVGQANGQPTATPEPKPDKQPVKERTSKAVGSVRTNFLRSDAFLIVVMIITMLSQMIHTAGFFYLNSPLEDKRGSIVLAALFALGADCTALVMTIRKGGLFYLWAFAIIHFLMNVALHAQVHAFDFSLAGVISVGGYALLSFVIAFSNFSYTELFAK